MGEAVDELRLLIVHPWLVHERGGERAFYELARAFPNADLAVFFSRLAQVPPDIAGRIRKTTFLNARALLRLPYRYLAPLLPAAAASIDTSTYQIVLSSSSGWAHGVRAKQSSLHLCYMYSPPRYLWTGERQPLPLSIRLAGAPLLPLLRVWDRRAAARVHKFAAISATIQARILAVYGRTSSLIYPPVPIDEMRLNTVDDRDYALTVAELVPYKRVDLAVAAAARAGVPLLVVGDGPERTRLESRAVGQAKFLGRVSRPQLRELMARARVFLFPAVEDFGLVTVEALASGTPVVGVARGGTSEIVDEASGVLAADQEVDQLAAALREAWNRRFDRENLRKRAEQFGVEAFRRNVRCWVDEASDEFALP